MKYFNEKYNRSWITLGDHGFVKANANTGYFFSNGGYVELLKTELREHNIKILTEKQLIKSIWQIKGWWLFIFINAIISFLIAWFAASIGS